MHTSEVVAALGEDAMASDRIRGFLSLDSQTVVSWPALRGVTGSSAIENFIEYDLMRKKRQEHISVELKVQAGTQYVQLQFQQKLYEADAAASIFAFNGQAYYLEELASVISLAQRLISAVPSCADSASLRRALLMIRRLEDDTFLWGDRLVCSFEELAVLVSARLTYKVRSVANIHLNGLHFVTAQNECRLCKHGILQHTCAASFCIFDKTHNEIEQNVNMA